MNESACQGCTQHWLLLPLFSSSSAHSTPPHPPLPSASCAVLELERSLMELHQIFLDMAVLVEAQGEMLDNIEAQVGGRLGVCSVGWVPALCLPGPGWELCIPPVASAPRKEPWCVQFGQPGISCLVGTL